MEELLKNAFDLVILSTNEYANVLEQTTEILKSIEHEKEKYNYLINNNEVLKKKIEEIGLAEERLYNAQRYLKK